MLDFWAAYGAVFPSKRHRAKIIPIQATTKKTNTFDSSQERETVESIIKLISDMGIKVGNKMKQEITHRQPERVKLSIEAFKQYRDTHNIKSQEACLLSMICDEAEPNTESQTQVSIKSPQKKVTTQDKSPKKLVDPDKLKKLSNIFNKKHD